MQTFKYKGIAEGGKKVSGKIDAVDEYSAMQRAKELCTVVSTLKPASDASLSKAFTAGKKPKDKSLAMLCSQFSIILGSGLPIVKALELLTMQTQDKALKKILVLVCEDVAAGYSLADSFEQRAPKLPVTFIETVRSGEQSGTLDASFHRLHDYYEKAHKMRSKVVSALSYPAFTCVVAVIVVAIIMVTAVPAFTKNFKELGIELPPITQALMSISDFIAGYGILLAIFFIALGLLIFLGAKTPKGKLALSKVMVRTPLLGKIVIMRSCGQFSSTMATMLSAGMPMTRSLSITSKAIGNAYIASYVHGTIDSIEQGKRIADGLRKCKYLPNLLVEITNVGEETGSLETMLETISTFYDNETDSAASRLISMIEPVVICVLAVVVMFILLAVYLPMFSMYDGLM